jgi:hypothetical protein
VASRGPAAEARGRAQAGDALKEDALQLAVAPSPARRSLMASADGGHEVRLEQFSLERFRATEPRSALL